MDSIHILRRILHQLSLSCHIKLQEKSRKESLYYEIKKSLSLIPLVDLKKINSILERYVWCDSEIESLEILKILESLFFKELEKRLHD